MRGGSLVIAALLLGCAEPAPPARLRVRPPPVASATPAPAVPPPTATMELCFRDIPLDVQELSLQCRVPVAKLARLSALERLKVVLLPEDVPAIAKLQGLAELRVELWADEERSQTMRPYDLSPLAALPKLHRLAILSPLVAELDQVARLPRLTALSVAGCTKVKDLGPLAPLSQLDHLDVFLTSVTDLAPIANMGLTSLNVGHTPIRSIAPLASMPELRALNLAGTDVHDLAPLASLIGLESLDLTSTLVTDAQVIASLSSL